MKRRRVCGSPSEVQLLAEVNNLLANIAEIQQLCKEKNIGLAQLDCMYNSALKIQQQIQNRSKVKPRSLLNISRNLYFVVKLFDELCSLLSFIIDCLCNECWTSNKSFAPC